MPLVVNLNLVLQVAMGFLISDALERGNNRFVSALKMAGQV